MGDEALFWSKKGEVACAQHIPALGDPRLTDEDWQPIPESSLRRITYQCQHCVAGRPIKHNSARVNGPVAPVVLNVDDRPASLYWRDRALRMHGFTVSNASTGEAALHAARQIHPHVVLLDVHLPDIDGREVCRKLKRDEKTASIPVVLISTTLRERGEDLQDPRAFDADGYVPEPCDDASLAETLWSVLRANGR